MNSILNNIVAIILARGGSKGIPKKNVKKFCGKPLIGWSILQAKKTNEISSIWVSTDDNKIAKIARTYNVNVIKRPRNISRDTSSSEEGWKHAIKEIINMVNNQLVLIPLANLSSKNE